MTGVEPVATCGLSDKDEHTVPEKLTLTMRRTDPDAEKAAKAASFKRRKDAFFKTSALSLLGGMLMLSQPAATGHLDASHLLGMGGQGNERWQTFLMASPAGSIHDATLLVDNQRGSALAHAGVGQLDPRGASRVAIAPVSLADDLITGSIPDARLPAGPDPLLSRDGRENRTLTAAVHAVVESRRIAGSLVEQHPFAQIELASLSTDGFSGYIGTVRPEPAIIVAEDAGNGIGETLGEGEAVAENTTGSEQTVAAPSEYAMAMVSPASAVSALAGTEGQQQISAFLNNDRQFECLAEGIYFEARGEPRRGQVAVAQVIMNRVNHDEFPDTICGVVYQNAHWRNRCQFSFACDGVPERITEQVAWDESESVARQVLEGRDLIDTITDSTHYHATYVSPRWAPRMIRLDRVGLHIFYKGRYGGWR